MNFLLKKVALKFEFFAFRDYIIYTSDNVFIFMEQKEKLYNDGGIVFPEGKITLLDGRELECYPCISELKGENCNVKGLHDSQGRKAVDYNNLEFDTTGRYLSFGKKRGRSKKYVEDSGLLAARRLFADNAFLLLQNRERILQDSRMFLAPVAVESGLAYTGTSGFRNPTVGVYLEWWSLCEGALRRDENGVRSLVYRLAGNPLSGVNKCTAIREDGKEETVSLRPFSDYWRSFMKINQRYSEAKSWYRAFTLQQVVEMVSE